MVVCGFLNVGSQSFIALPALASVCFQMLTSSGFKSEASGQQCHDDCGGTGDFACASG